MELTTIIDEIYSDSKSEEIVTQHAKTIATRISAKELQLHQLIEALGPKLTSLEVQDRVKAMDFLSQVFSFLKPDFLSEKELTFIVDFLHDRLKDQHMVIPKTFLCILPIVRCTNLPEGSATKLLNQIFREGNVQSHTHKHRRAVFLTFEYCLRNWLEELKKQSSTDFVMNFLQSMDGEKDPRNLLILFHCIPIILTHFPLGPFVEDFFEVLSCYFPIDFKPSAPVPGGEIITREDLAQPLHTCLSQTNEFCKLLIPLLMEKLDSSVIDAKLDALLVLGMCCERSYTAEDINPFLATIWHALRREIFMGGNELVETACINFLRYAFSLLSKNPNILESCVSMIFKECKHHLSEPELRLSQPTARILAAMAEGSQESCQAVLSLTVPLLHEQFSVKPLSSVRKGILGIMTTLISTLRLYPSVRLTTALPNWDEVLAMWFTLLTHSDPEFILLALQFFAKLLSNSLRTTPNEVPEVRLELPSESEGKIQPPSYDEDLNAKSRTLLQEHLLSLLLRQDSPAEVRSSVITTMAEIARGFGEEFVETCVCKLMPAVHDDGLIQESALNALAECSAYPIVARSVIPSLLNCEMQSGFDERILLCFASIVEKGCESNASAEVAKEFTNLLVTDLQALKIFMRVTSTHSQRIRSQDIHAPYLILTRIVRILVRSSSEAMQQAHMDSFWNIPVKNDGGNCTQTMEKIPPLLLEALLGSVRPTVEIHQKNELMRFLLDRSTTNTSTPGRTELEKYNSLDELATIRLYSALLNKSNDAEFPILLSVLESKFNLDVNGSGDSERIGESKEQSPCNEPEQSEVDNSDLKRLMTFFTTVVKALAMRGVGDLDKWIGKLIGILDNPNYGLMMSNEFGTLMSDCPYSLNSKSFCNFRFLYKQRLFLACVPKLVAAYQRNAGSSGGAKANYMRALSSQLRHVPAPVLQMQIDNVFPLLVGSLSIDSEMNQESNTQILLSTLNALRDFFKSQSEQSGLGKEGVGHSALVEYFHDMTPRLVTLTQFKSSMEVRILALKCLQCCAKLPTHVVLPLKPSVTASLKLTLDDPKRLVRREAAITRNIWILVGAPGGF